MNETEREVTEFHFDVCLMRHVKTSAAMISHFSTQFTVFGTLQLDIFCHCVECVPNYLCSRIIPYFQETLIHAHAQRFFGCGHEKRVWGEAVVRDTYARDMFHCSTELQTLIWMTTVWHSQRKELFFKIRKLHSSSGGREQRTRLDVVACRAFIFIFECTAEVSVGLSCKYFFLLSGSFFFCSILSRNWQLKLDSLTNFSRVFISVDVSSGHWELGQLRGQEKWPT